MVQAVRGQVVVVVDTRSLVVGKEAARMGLKAIGAGHAVVVVGMGKKRDHTDSGQDLVLVARCLGVGNHGVADWIVVDNLEVQSALLVVADLVG